MAEQHLRVEPDGGILRIFKESGALLEGHFQLTSGKHSARYIQCAQVLQHPALAGQLGQELAAKWRERGVDTVIGPACGGIIVAHEVARALGCRALFTEREHGAMKLRRGFRLRPGEKVLIVEDVITTGGSIREVIEAARDYGALPLGVAALVDRSGGQAEFAVPFTALVKLSAEAYPPDNCPLCAQGLPAVKPGSRDGGP